MPAPVPDQLSRRSPSSCGPANYLPIRARARGARVLRLLAVVTALGASTTGLLLDAAYDTATATTEMLRGYDLVTLVVVSAALVIGLGRRHDDDTVLWPGL